MLVSGETIHAKLDAYELGDLLVEGRFGSTFLARRTSDDKEVIIKTILRPGSTSFAERENFERVVDQLRRLEHASIAGYLDGAILSHKETLVLVQQRARGYSLKEILDASGRMSHDDALSWLEGALVALVHVHGQNPAVVHGDLDWGNIFLDEDKVQLVDFATVRQEILNTRELSVGMVTGELNFAPMEQLFGKVYPASDLYALAMTFLAMVTGLLPADFPIKGMRADVDALLGHGAPSALVQLIKHMSEPDPGHRLDNAQIALERVRALRFSDAPPVRVGTQEVSKTPAPAPVSEPAPGRREVLTRLSHRATTWLDELDRNDAWQGPPEYAIERVYALGANEDATHLLVAHAHEALLLDADSLSVRGRVEFDELARRATISRDGKRVAILTGHEDLLCFDAQFSIWQRHHIEVEGMWPGNSQLTISPSGEHIAISDDDQVNIYDWNTAELLHKHDVDGQYGLTFDPSGETLYAVGATHITALGLRGQREEMEGDGIAFSPDGNLVAITQGASVRFGPLDPEAPTRDWNHSVVKLPGMSGRLNLVAFSPNQRTLVIAGQEGGMRMVDLTEEVVRPWEDARADAHYAIKIFQVSFSPDSLQILVHANLPSDEEGKHKQGSVLSFSHEDGRFLGSLVWGEDTLMIQSRSGFFGDIDQIERGGFSTDIWRRPRVAFEEFRGDPPGGALGIQERAALMEFHARKTTLQHALSLEPGRWELAPVVDAVAGVSHILPEVFDRAEASFQERQSQGHLFASITLTEHIVEEARGLAGQSSEIIEAIHHRLLGDDHMHVHAQDLSEREGSYYDDDSFEGSSYDEDIRAPASAQRTLHAPEPDVPAPEQNAVHREEAHELTSSVPMTPFMSFMVSMFLGFLPTFVGLSMLDANALSELEFYAFLAIPGPILAMVLSRTVFRAR